MDPKKFTLESACTPCVGRLVALLFPVVVMASLLGCNETDPTGTDLTTSSEGAQAGPSASVVAADASAGPMQPAAATSGTIPLPIIQTVTSPAYAFSITQKGGGTAGSFTIDNPTGASHAVVGQTNGNGYSVAGWAWGKSTAGYFEINNPTNSRPALHATTNGTGYAVNGVARGIGNAAVFQNTYPNNSKPAL
jgi:hypothetical protein